VGQWKGNRFLGERMSYTSERIYGIDISRYQHGKGRKKYPILWDRLRISYLGNKNQQHATGTVDYPVSFVFIKSTESTSIRNPFFANDYTKARQQGISVGAYHFFSCKMSGSAQAQYFLGNTLFRSGDLPPVLDLEPSHGQIAAMGGTEALFRHVRAWLKAVEAHTGVKPILYVNQMFVNRYLGDAPDLKRDYQVWIARYGEFRPDVKLAVWQLSPNGRVRGITGEVDINVFNGFHKQWEDFLDEMTIK
jgi:lysozyme